MSAAVTAAQVAALKAERRSALQDAIDAIDTKPRHIFFDTLRREFVAVLKVFDAEDALHLQASAPATTPANPAATSDSPAAGPSFRTRVKSTLARHIANATKSLAKG